MFFFSRENSKGSNHYSIAGHWALMAEAEGLIGMAFTNTSPVELKIIQSFISIHNFLYFSYLNVKEIKYSTIFLGDISDTRISGWIPNLYDYKHSVFLI